MLLHHPGEHDVYNHHGHPGVCSATAPQTSWHLPLTLMAISADCHDVLGGVTAELTCPMDCRRAVSPCCSGDSALARVHRGVRRQ